MRLVRYNSSVVNQVPKSNSHSKSKVIITDGRLKKYKKTNNCSARSNSI